MRHAGPPRRRPQSASQAAGVAQLPSGSGAAPVSGAEPDDDGDSADGSAAAAPAQPRRPGAPRGTYEESDSDSDSEGGIRGAEDGAGSQGLDSDAEAAAEADVAAAAAAELGETDSDETGSAPVNDVPATRGAGAAIDMREGEEEDVVVPGQRVAVERTPRRPPSLVSRSSLPPRPPPAGSSAAVTCGACAEHGALATLVAAGASAVRGRLRRRVGCCYQ